MAQCLDRDYKAVGKHIKISGHHKTTISGVREGGRGREGGRREGGREGRREGGREGDEREGGRGEEREGEREGGEKKGRERGREGGEKKGRERGREGEEREGGEENFVTFPINNAGLASFSTSSFISSSLDGSVQTFNLDTAASDGHVTPNPVTIATQGDGRGLRARAWLCLKREFLQLYLSSESNMLNIIGYAPRVRLPSDLATKCLRQGDAKSLSNQATTLYTKFINQVDTPHFFLYLLLSPIPPSLSPPPSLPPLPPSLPLPPFPPLPPSLSPPAMHAKAALVLSARAQGRSPRARADKN